MRPILFFNPVVAMHKHCPWRRRGFCIGAWLWLLELYRPAGPGQQGHLWCSCIVNGKGCQGLSSQGMRDKCLDEALYPSSSSSRTRVTRPKPAVPARLASDPPSAALAAPPLSDAEVKHLEQVLGVNGGQP